MDPCHKTTPILRTGDPIGNHESIQFYLPIVAATEVYDGLVSVTDYVTCTLNSQRLATVHAKIVDIIIHLII